jgi:hypothetical protein
MTNSVASDLHAEIAAGGAPSLLVLGLGGVPESVLLALRVGLREPSPCPK